MKATIMIMAVILLAPDTVHSRSAILDASGLMTGGVKEEFILSEVDQPPTIVRKVDPIYPSAAKRDKVQGSVTIRFVVTKEGKVIDPSVIKSMPEGVFDEVMLDTIVKWKFNPAVKDGKAVGCVIVAPFEFRSSTDTTPANKYFREKLSEFGDLDSFLAWIGKQPGIHNVHVNKRLFLTTDPPQVAITFSQNGVKHKLLVAIEVEQKLKLAKPR